MMKNKASVVVVLLFSLISYGSSTRSFIHQPSDGIYEHADQKGQLSRFYSDGIDEPLKSCEMKYGFLPCANGLPGYIFLIVLYEYLLFVGASYVSAGSELIFVIIGPNVFGSSVFRILCAIPKSLILLESVLQQSKDKAENKIMVGIGTLAGSTIFLLTVLWGSCVMVGKSDLECSNTRCPQDTKGLSFVGSGIKTDKWTSYAARIMAISVIPFLFVQMHLLFQSSSGRNPIILVSLITCNVFLVSYAAYQVSNPWIQSRSLEYVKLKHVISGILQHLERNSLGSLLKEDGEINTEVLRKLFRAADLNGDGHLSTSELRALIIGIQFEEINLNHDNIAQNLLMEIDTSGDSHVDEDEFIIAVSKWINEAKRSIRLRDPCSSNKFLYHYHLQTKEEHDLLLDKDEKEDVQKLEKEREAVKQRKHGILRAIATLALGVAIATVFAGSLVDAVNDFSKATSIPSFFTSFVVVPLATNLKGAVSGITFVSKKKRKNASLALSEIYGAVFMNNTLSLAVFLALVYIRGLTWDFSAEVWVIILVCSVMGLITSFRTSFPLWTSIVAFLLYPISLVLVYAQRK